MDTGITLQQIITVGGFLILLASAAAAIWFRIESRVKDASDKAGKVAEDLAAHRLHVAETYITKEGMRETMRPMMDAISAVKAAVDHMTARVDRIVENQRNRQDD